MYTLREGALDVLDTLLRCGPSTVGEVCADTGRKTGGAHHILRRLAALGLVRHDGVRGGRWRDPGRYALTEWGDLHLVLAPWAALTQFQRQVLVWAAKEPLHYTPRSGDGVALALRVLVRKGLVVAVDVDDSLSVYTASMQGCQLVRSALLAEGTCP